mmetsp:Transcript_2854/g.11343  ORF Transcript_2854/g.11343 Transcript_2854/m.11343 type:complete len:314 (+) Transcript_2854:354-1295(+)
MPSRPSPSASAASNSSRSVARQSSSESSHAHTSSATASNVTVAVDKSPASLSEPSYRESSDDEMDESESFFLVPRSGSLAMRRRNEAAATAVQSYANNSSAFVRSSSSFSSLPLAALRSVSANEPPRGAASAAASAALRTKAPDFAFSFAFSSLFLAAKGRISESHSSGANSAPWSRNANAKASALTPFLTGGDAEEVVSEPPLVSSFSIPSKESPHMFETSHSSACASHARAAASSTALISRLDASRPFRMMSDPASAALESTKNDSFSASSNAARRHARRTAPSVPYACSFSTTVEASASAWLAAPRSRTQ